MSSYTEDVYDEDSSEAPLITIKQTQQLIHIEPIQKVVRTQTQLLTISLTEHGIAMPDVQKLVDQGYPTVKSIYMETFKNLKNIKGLSEQKITKIKQVCEMLVGSRLFITADECLQEMQDILLISSGCQDFDNLLRGGFETSQICEIFGEFRSGKSQICHTLAVLGQQAHKKNMSSNQLLYKIVYIDTEGTFRPDRIAQIAQQRKLNAMSVLSNIVVAKVHNHEQQMQIMRHIGTLLSKSKYSCIIIDSLTQFFRQDFQGRSELSERQQRLNVHLNQLAKLAKEYNVLILVTNQIQAVVDGTAMFGGESKRPVGGHILAHASTMRLSLRKGRGEQRIVKVYDSPMLPETEAIFSITERGIDDYNV